MDRNRKGFVAGTILVSALLAVAGVLVFSQSGPQGIASAAQSPQWTQETGAGISVPACSSSSANATCNNGSPLVTINWGSSPHMTDAQDCFLSIGGSLIWSGFCNAGPYPWSGGSNNTTYSYLVTFWGWQGQQPYGQIGEESGPFTTPNCAPAQVCTPRSTRACTTGQGCPGTETCSSDGLSFGSCADNPGDNCPAAPKPDLIPQNLNISF